MCVEGVCVCGRCVCVWKVCGGKVYVCVVLNVCVVRKVYGFQNKTKQIKTNLKDATDKILINACNSLFLRVCAIKYLIRNLGWPTEECARILDVRI